MKNVWLVRFVDGDESWEDAYRVRADSDKEAAELWAEADDSYHGDFTIVGGSPATVEVALMEAFTTDDDTGELKVPPSRRFIVSGESVPVYRAVEVKG